MSILSVSRREFMARVSAASAALTMAHLPVAHSQSPAASTPLQAVSVTIGATAGATVPADFIGLSYEVMQLEDASFFSPKNVGLVQQFRALCAHGVLRLGGNTSEFSWWKATQESTAPVRPKGVEDDGEPDPNTLYAVTPEAIQNLKGFLDATGWTCIYGLNLGYGTVATDVAEAQFVYQTLGKRLRAFQIGNEVDLFWRHLRDKATWNVDTYMANWLQIARAVQTACPGAVFGMPDVASDVNWLTQIADKWDAIPDKPHVTTLTHHYYVGGPPANPEMNISKILHPDPKVEADARIAKAAAVRMGVGYRMTEGNTCYQAGKDGVSDVYASALWSATYLFQLMQLGYSGVNLHGGSGHATAVSVGNVLRGEKLMADQEAPHPKPFYTPIANEGTLAGRGVDGKLNGKYVLEPVGVGMKFSSAFAGATMLPCSLEGLGGLNVVAFAARRVDGKVMVAILNKEASAPVQITAPNFQTLQTLTAASLEARSAEVKTVVRETASRRTSAGQTFILPAHTGTLLLLA